MQQHLITPPAPSSDPKDCWRTPPSIITPVTTFFWGKQPAPHNKAKALDHWFDPCPPNPKFDGLQIVWADKNYCNPPYSNPLPWAEKAVEELDMYRAYEIVFCLNHDHSTKWWKTLQPYIAAICLLDRRVKFCDPATYEQAEHGGEKPTVLIYCISPVYQDAHYFMERVEWFQTCFSDLGPCFMTMEMDVC